MFDALPPFVIRGGIMILVLIILLALLGGLTLLVRRPWWPSVIFQTGQRPRIYVPWLIGSFAVPAIVGAAIFGPAGLAIMTLLWFAFAPPFIGPRGTKASWDSDKPEERAEALAVRNRIRSALGETDLDGKTYWNQYVLDRARAIRQAKYRPPGN